ncbi:MAG: hypothetical protein WC569_06010 [Candidatus Omnitrophota bacterium]
MRNIHKIINIAVIYMIIGVFLCQDTAYPLETGHLRVPLGKDGGRRKEAALAITGKDAKQVLNRVYVSEDFRNGLIGTFFQDGSEILRFRFNKEGEIISVSIMKTQGGKTVFLKPGEFMSTHPDLWRGLEGFKTCLRHARFSSLGYILPEGASESLKDKNVINDVWFVLKAPRSLGQGNPYFEYRGARISGTNFGTIPILPFRFLKLNFKNKGFNGTESYYILQQALMHEMAAIYKGYFSDLNAEESHAHSGMLEYQATFDATVATLRDRKKVPLIKYVSAEKPHSILDEFMLKYSISEAIFPQSVKRRERNENGYLFVEGLNDAFSVKFNVKFKIERAGAAKEKIRLNAGTREFIIERLSEVYFQGHEILEGNKFRLDPSVTGYLYNLYALINEEIERIRYVDIPRNMYILNEDVEAVVTCALNENSDPLGLPVMAAEIKFYHKGQEIDAVLTMIAADKNVRNDVMARDRRGFPLGLDTEMTKTSYTSLVGLSFVLASHRADESFPGAMDSLDGMGINKLLPKKDYAAVCL